jgi:hypothetical protein
MELNLKRVLQSIAKHQAQMTTALRELSSIVKDLAKQQMELAQIVQESQRGMGSALIGVIEHQKQMAEEQLRLAESLRSLADAQRSTAERFNALINIVDGWIPRRPPQ